MNDRYADGFWTNGDDESLDERFADWVDGRLSDEQSAALAAAMESDPDLRHQAEEYRRTVTLLRQHLAEDLAGDHEEPPEDLVPTVLDQLPGAQPRSRIIPLLGSIAAAAAMVMLFVYLRDVTQQPDVKEAAKVTIEPTADSSRKADTKSSRDSLELEHRPAMKKPGQPAPSMLAPREQLEEEKVAGKKGKVADERQRDEGLAELANEKKKRVESLRKEGPYKLAQKPVAEKAKAVTDPAGAPADRKNVDARAKGMKSEREAVEPRQRFVAGGRSQPQQRESVGSVVRKLTKLHLDELVAAELVMAGESNDAKPADRDAANRDAANRADSAPRRTRARSAPGNEAGRGGRGGAAPEVEQTPVLVLGLSGLVSGYAADVRERANKKADQKDKAAETKSQRGGRSELDEQDAPATDAARSLLLFVQSKNVKKADVGRPRLTRLSDTDLPRAENKPVATDRFGFSSAAVTYSYRPGDEAYEVVGTPEQLQQFFIDLKYYLATVRPATAKSKTSAKVGRETGAKRAATKIPMRLERYARVREPAGRRAKARPSKANEPEAMRFVLVLRTR